MTYYSRTDGAPKGLSGMLAANPEGLLLLAAGAALLMRGGRKSSTGKTSSNWHEQRARKWENRSGEPGEGQTDGWVPQQISKVAGGAKEYAAGIGDTVAETVSSVASTAREYAADAGRSVSRQSERLAGQATTTFRQTVDRVLEEQPLAVVIAGIAAGAAVAAALPTTRLEGDALGQARDKVSDLASAATARLGEAASAAGERLADVAEKKGLTSEGLKDAARDVAGVFEKKLAGDEEPTPVKEVRTGSTRGVVGSSDQGPAR